MGVHRIVVPALGARIERVNEGRPADRQRLAHLVHRVHGVGGVDGRDVLAVGMTGGQHRRGVLLPAPVHDAPHLARRAEGGVRTPGRRARHLDVGVGVRLVVVHQDQQVVLGVLERRGNRRKPHVGAAAVAAHRDHVDRFLRHLALAHHHFQGGGGAGGGRARGSELGVHPGDRPRGGVVGGVGHVHAPRAAEDDRARAARLGHELHELGRLAALTGAMTRGEILFRRDLLGPPPGFENLGVEEVLKGF